MEWWDPAVLTPCWASLGCRLGISLSAPRPWVEWTHTDLSRLCKQQEPRPLDVSRMAARPWLSCRRTVSQPQIPAEDTADGLEGGRPRKHTQGNQSFRGKGSSSVLEGNHGVEEEAQEGHSKVRGDTTGLRGICIFPKAFEAYPAKCTQIPSRREQETRVKFRNFIQHCLNTYLKRL